MKKLTLALIAFLLINTAFSQTSNLVFYNQEGNRFYVIMNGVKMNSDPQTNVKITDLPQPYYKVKILFEDKALGEVDKTLNFNPGTETVFQIKKNNKNEWTIRWQSEVPMAQAAPAAQGQTVLIYNAAGVPTPSANPTAATTSSATITTTTTTSGTVNPGGDNNVYMNMEVPGATMNVNINSNTNNSATVTSSTTTTTTTSGGNTTVVVPNNQTTYSMPGYSGAVGCPWPMADQDFAAAKQSIAAKGFDDTKLTIAKQVISSNCLFSRQVKELMLLFSFEDTRLQFAKFAYGFTFDIGNYFMLNDAFQFESSIDELNKYISTQH
jgi:hypothetical protein